MNWQLHAIDPWVINFQNSVLFKIFWVNNVKIRNHIYSKWKHLFYIYFELWKTMKCLCKNNWFIYKRIKVIDKSYYSIKFLTSVVFPLFLSWDQLYLLITLLAMYTKISFIFLLIKCNKFPRYSLNVVFVVYYKGVVFTFYVLLNEIKEN